MWGFSSSFLPRYIISLVHFPTRPCHAGALASRHIYTMFLLKVENPQVYFTRVACVSGAHRLLCSLPGSRGWQRCSLLNCAAGTSSSRAMTSRGFGLSMQFPDPLRLQSLIFVSCHFWVCGKTTSHPMNETTVIFWWYSWDYSWSCPGSGLCCREWLDVCITFLGMILDRWS